MKHVLGKKGTKIRKKQIISTLQSTKEKDFKKTILFQIFYKIS